MRLAAFLALAFAAFVLALFLAPRKTDPPPAPPGVRSTGAPRTTPAALEGGVAARGPADTSGSNADPTDTEPKPAPWHVLARVKDEEGRAIAEATVTLWLARGQDYEFLREARTGADGRLELDLSVLRARTRNHLAARRLLGWAFAPGHASSGMPSKIQWWFPDHVEPGVWRLDFELRRSQVAAGRVVDEAGQGLASVQVSVGTPEEQRPDLHDTQAFTAPDGRYALPLTTTGKANVVAELRGHQRAATAWFQAKGRADVRVSDLALTPVEPVPGVVRFADGSPVAGLTLTVWHTSFDPHTYTWTPRLGPILARTDADGKFAVALPPPSADEREPYEVHLDGRRAGKGIALAAETRLHALTLEPHRLRVRLQDERAAPLAGLEVSFLGLHGFPPAWAVTDAEGEASLFLEPGSAGEIHFLAAGSQLVRRAVTVPEEGNESVLLVGVPDVRDMGALDLRLAAPEGLPIEHAVVTIRSGGIEVATGHLRNGSVRIPLPAGTYGGSILARGLDWYPGSPATSAFMDVAQPFVIRAGTTLERTEPWTRTARLSVRAHTREPDEGVEWRTSVRRADGTDEHVMLERSGGDPVGMPLHWDETLYSNLVPPGAYVLHIEAAGYRPWQRDLNLIHGRLEHVEVELERAK